jgi:cysteine desulfurase / selenocysteine lyase
VPPLPAYDLNEVRRAFPIAQRVTYLNHASIAPIPRPAQQAMCAAAERLALDPASLFSPAPGDPLGNVFTAFCTEFAAHIHADTYYEVIPLSSTSAGINTVAQSIQWEPGDNVVLCEVEFPSNAYPWMNLARTRGVEVRLAPALKGGAELDAFEPLVDERTRLIAVSAVQFLSGHRAVLAAFGAFCRAHGILFVVDAIQAAGHMPIDVQAMQIDALASGGQKSLMGPPGQGFLYVREAVADTMVPAYVGPNAVEGWKHWLAYDLTPQRAAFRFLQGTWNAVGMVGLTASLRFLRELGLDAIDAWTRHLSQVAREDLAARDWPMITPQDPANVGPILTFRVGDPADPVAADIAAEACMALLKARHIQVTKHWDAAKVPHLRISTHCYNTEDEVRLVGATLEEQQP